MIGIGKNEFVDTKLQSDEQYMLMEAGNATSDNFFNSGFHFNSMMGKTMGDEKAKVIGEDKCGGKAQKEGRDKEEDRT
eukprot:Awhi_evm1s13206